MNEEGSIISYVLKQEFSTRNLHVNENATFKFGRKTFVLDFYLKDDRVGIITMNWKRTIPTKHKIKKEESIEWAKKNFGVDVIE